MVMCEKPLGRNAGEAEAMTEAVEAATVWYNYRRVPAVVLLKYLIDEGRFGRIVHYRAKFPQDWTGWRGLVAPGCRCGVTGDLLTHAIDSCTVAERIDQRSRGHDRNIYQRA
jgi:predicted dehydrogenase